MGEAEEEGDGPGTLQKGEVSEHSLLKILNGVERSWGQQPVRVAEETIFFFF